MDPALLNLVIAILGLLTGALAATIYHRITANDLGDALAEAERLIAGQALRLTLQQALRLRSGCTQDAAQDATRDKELLQREFAYINGKRDEQLLGLAEQIDLLEAEIEKLRAQ